jgi:putative transposase
MPDYRRFFAPGGTFFFTLVTYDRQPLFRSADARRVLRDAITETRARRPFEMPGIALLPEHLHCLWTLPAGDADFSTRWRKIKESFTRAFAHIDGRDSPVSPGQRRKGLRGFWQPRFWNTRSATRTISAIIWITSISIPSSTA